MTMSPDDLRTALLFGERTKEFFERIPKDALVMATISLTKHNEDARACTQSNYLGTFWSFLDGPDAKDTTQRPMGTH